MYPVNLKKGKIQLRDKIYIWIYSLKMNFKFSGYKAKLVFQKIFGPLIWLQMVRAIIISLEEV